nr:hypothetical protein CFP56_25685 [Quercus suber]
METGRFGKVRGRFLGGNLERENVGIKEQKQARKTYEPTPKSADRHDDNPSRHVENVAGAKSFSQSRVHEPGAKSFSQFRLHEENLWQPPPVGSVKANFVEAVFGEEQEGGIRVVIRNNEGRVLATLSVKVPMPTSMEILEFLAARRVATFARDLGF